MTKKEEQPKPEKPKETQKPITVDYVKRSNDKNKTERR
jgi:hypothetical protein